MSKQKWTPFYFDGNMFSGRIDSYAMWERLSAAYADDYSKILNAKEATYGGTRGEAERKQYPKYGLRIECDGEPLRAFLRRNNMDVGGRSGPR